MHGGTAQSQPIHILSSSEEDDDRSNTCEESDESESYITGAETDAVSLDESDDEKDGQQESSDDANVVNGYTSDESLSNYVAHLLQKGASLERLTMREYKAYLRLNGLRLSGSKEVCLARVKEHWRLSNENAEALYPRSSFVINCTGDVCMGDVVLFRQKVLQSFSKMARRLRVLGKRTVAGRVVKESYGRDKQQHTFTVEVLWSWGAKKPPPLSPMFIKGRNLYKMKTFRQPWPNEKERERVLMEKHERGDAARQVRANKRASKGSRKGGKKRLKKTDGATTSGVKSRGGKNSSSQGKNTSKTKKKNLKGRIFKSPQSSKRDSFSSSIPLPPMNTLPTPHPRKRNRFPRAPLFCDERQNVEVLGHPNMPDSHVPHFTHESHFYMQEDRNYNRFLGPPFRPLFSHGRGNTAD